MGTSDCAATPELLVLPAKVHVPACVPDAIVRPAAQARLARALSCRLTTVVAPAGYGKTTAVLSWLAASAAKAPSTPTAPSAPACDRAPAAPEAPAAPAAPTVAWYSASGEDASLDRFWTHMVEALRTACEGLLPGARELGVSDDPARTSAAVDRIIVALDERRQHGPLVFVLDDAHAVLASQEVAASFQHFVRYLPDGVHLVVTSRSALPIQLARMRVRDELVELTEEDLRFSPAEVGELFARRGIGLAADELADVVTLTHGWPTGCRLVTMPCGEGSQADVSRALVRARTSMSDYLFEEVLLGLPPEQRDFLERTSVVDAFCPSLACAITGWTSEEVAAVIDALFAGSLFVERIEREGTEDWYRYQPLFADLLHARSGGALGRLRDARTAARAWFEQAGYFDAAIELCAELEDWEGIRRIIRDRWRSLYMSDAHAVLVRWASYLPEGEILASPYVCVILSMPLALHGEVERANALIMHAVTNLKERQDFLFAFCAVQKAFLASFRADVTSMRLYAEKALAFLPEDDYYLRGMMLQVQASSHAHTEPLRSRELLTRAVEEQQAFGNDNLTCSALGNLALVCANLGSLDEAAHEARRAFALYDPDEFDRKPMLGYALLSRAIVSWGRGAYHDALDDCDAYARITCGGITREVNAEVCVVRAKALLGLGRHPDALEALTRGIDLDEAGVASALPSPDLLGQVPRALLERLARHADDERAWPSLRVLGFEAQWCLGVSDGHGRASALAEGIDPDERSLFVQASLVACLLSERAAHTQRAEEHLERAVLHARACDLTSLLGGAPALVPVATRLAGSSRDATVIAFLHELCARDRQEGAGQVSLTEREIDVVRLVAAGMSVAQVAEALVVSRETAKKHLANIYAKLGVHSKMQAVALLRERGLI